MNGAVAWKVRAVGPAFTHDPGTGGLKAGMPDAPASGADMETVTTWSDGTSVAPVAGTVDATVSALAAGNVVVPAARARAVRPVAWPCRPATNAPAAARTTTARAATIHTAR
jgi:hypothetical protein